MVKIEDDATRELWLEVNSQILNGLFTVMALILQPARLVLGFLTIKYLVCSYPQKLECIKQIKKWFPDFGIFAVNTTKVEIQADTDPEATPRNSAELSAKDMEYFDVTKWICIVLLLNGQCFFQYPITIVHWAYRKPERPVWVVATFLPLSFLCMAISGIWIALISKSKNKMSTS
jgi:hypothetical protein